MQSFSDYRKGMADVGEGNEAACRGVYSIILDLIKEEKYAKFVNNKGRYVIDWCRAVDCYLEYIAKKDPEKFERIKIDRKKASNKLLAALINNYKKEGAMHYLDTRKLNEKGEVVERQLQMPKRFESFYGGVQVTDDSEGDEQDTSIIASEDDNNAEVRPACNSSASDTGYDEGMDNSSYDSIGTACFSVSGNVELAVSHMDISDSEEDISTYLSAQQREFWNKGGQSDIMSANTETLDDIYGWVLLDKISHIGEADDYQQVSADVTMSAAPEAQVSGEYSRTSVEELATSTTSEEDLSQNHRINADLPLEVTMDPQRVPLQGGGLHSFDFNSVLPPRVQSGFATYGDLATGVLERLNDSLIGRWIPPKKEPGWVLVKLYSQSNEYMGDARLFYFNEEKEWVKKVAQDENLLRDLFKTLAISYGTKAENSRSETLNSGNLEGKHSGSTRPLQVLQLLVYAAAECGAQQCIKIILNSSAGRGVFDAYKDSSPLPVVIARKHGYEEIAHYLEDVTTRFGSEKTMFREGSQTIDWAELVAAAEAAQEERELNIASREENHQVESDETSDTEYFGDAETTSKDSSQLSRSGSEDDDSEISFEEKKVETHGYLNEGCNAQKENVTKRQTSHLIFHRPVTSLSGFLSMSFINEGVFSSKQLNGKGRRNSNNPTLEEKCFFRMIEHFYREVYDLQRMKSVHHPSISFLLSIANERIPHHLSTMYERWRIQLQFNRDSGENIAHRLSLLFHKMDLDSPDGRLAISLTQPAVVGEINFVQDLEQLYVDDGLSTPNDEDSPIKGKALDYPTKYRYTASDAWVLTGIYRPTRMILFVYVADRSDALPPELWFEDEDCEFFTECWKWQRCGNNSLKFIERLKGMQERPEIESEQENKSLFTLSSEQVFLGNDANSLGGCELVLREYQKELAEPAVQGKNTIICAPTNSGKTYVAIEIVKRHLDSFSSEAEQSAKPAANSTSRNEGRVVFIVSTVNLVLQQKERFEAFLGNKYSVGEISGANSTDIPLKYLLQSHSVVVMTAQILVNALKNENKEERVELKDISLLLFDECHHAHKEHPYNSIMEKYLALKFQPGYRHSLPKIIGLTASLGTGKAQSVEKAEEHIILVSANLDAEVISTVQKNKAELEKFVNVPSQEVHHVPKNDQDPFEKIIFKVMAQIELQLKKIKGKSYKAGPPDKGGQQYRQWVEEFYKDSVASGDRYLVTYAEHLREYHVALTLNTNTRMKNARRYLQKYFGSLDREKFTEIDARLEQLFHKAMQALDKFVEKNGGEPENSQLTKLKELLLQNYKELQQSNKDQPDETENGGESKDGNEGDGKRTYSTSDNSSEKADNKEDNMSDEIEASKLADDKGTENTQDENDEKEGKFAQEETSEKEDGNQPEDASNDDDSVVEANGENGSEAMDDAKGDSGSSSETAQEDESDERNAQYHPEWEGPKGILFTRTRESTEALLDWIKETEELNAVLRPELLVGSGDGNIGMTQNEQERVIKRFKTGEKNILLATSVAEEGLDISDCNYVIRYDMMGNEISSVQSRGRVRADVGKYSVLVGQSGALKRERTSRFPEILMTEALTKVQSMNPEKFKVTVKDVQKTSYRDRFIKKHIYALKKSEFLPDDVTFRCRKCTKVVCQAHDVRRIKGSHHVIINSELRDTKVDVRKHPKPKIIDDIEMSKKIFCKKCGEDWGVTALISNVEWLCIKISSFVLEFPDRNPPRRMYKKWKDLPFGIEEASMEEILDHGFDKGPVDNLLDVDFDH